MASPAFAQPVQSRAGKPLPPPAAPAARLLLNGAELAGLQPVRHEGALYLPLGLAESLGAEVYLQPGARAASVAAPGHLYALRDGSPRTGRGEPPMARPCLWRDGVLLVPAEFFRRLDAEVAGQGVDAQVQAEALPIAGARVAFDPEKLQVVLPLPRRTGASLVVSDSAHVTLNVHGAAWQGEPPLLVAGEDRLVSAAAAGQAGGVAQVRLQLRYRAPVRLYWLEQPTRLVLEVPRAFAGGATEQVAAGLRYSRFVRGAPERQTDFHLVRVALGDPAIAVRPGVVVEAAGSKARARLAPLSALAQRHGALAAVNASYFSNKTEEPLGLLMIDRQLVTPPLYNRTGLGLTRDGRAVVAPSSELAPLTLLVEGRDGRSIDSFNVQSPPEGITLYTPSFGPRTPLPPRDRETPAEFAVNADGIVQPQAGTPTPIPPGGYVLSGRGAGAKWLQQYLRPGLAAGLLVDPGERSDVAHALGGGPRLLQDGVLRNTGAEELFKDDILRSRAPRTLAGVSAGGRDLLLLVTEGRQPARSLPGPTLDEAAALLQQAGAREGLNFDGGGSSTLYLQSRVLNRPSDGKERRVSGSLLIVPSRAATR